MKQKKLNRWSESRQLSLEDNISVYEKQMQQASVKAVKRITNDIKLLLDEFSGELTKEQSKMLLDGLVSNKTLAELSKQWEEQGMNLEELISRKDWVRTRITNKQLAREIANVNMDIVKNQQIDIMNQAMQFTVSETNARRLYDLSRASGYDLRNNLINQKQVNAILRTNWSGTHFSKRVWHNNKSISKEIKELFLEKELIGSTTQDIVNHLKQISDSSMYECSRLIRTESNAMRTMTEKEDAKRLDIRKYINIATLDMKTSLICQKQDLKVHEWDKMEIGVNAPPFHPHCRTIASDFFDDMDMSNLKRAARDKDGNTIYIKANISYDKWLQDINK